MDKKLFSLFLIFLISTSCKYGSTDGVEKPYKKLVKNLQDKYEENKSLSDLYRLDMAKKVQNDSEELVAQVNEVKKFSRKYYVFENKENVTTRLDDMKSRISDGLKLCEDKSLDLQKLIYGIGKHSYEKNKDKLVHAVLGDIIDSEILTLFSLQYIKRVYETCAGLTFHYMNEFSVEKYDDRPEVLSFRKELLSKFLALTGMLKVISNDSQNVSQGLLELKENNYLSDDQVELIEELAMSMKNATGKLQEFTDSVLEKGIPNELKDTYKEALAKSDELFKDKTLLFDPANPDHPVLHLLVILSNLSWGSVQSAIGLGIVLTHTLIMTPASWVLDALFPRYFMPLRGTKIKIARNKMQLYADVCGFPAIPSKMSMGIWELDFCTGYYFASAHEGGHAKQSALLGPLYLPAAILSYAINMGHGGFIESWADDWYVQY